MPYIKQELRRELDKEIEAFVKKVNELHAKDSANTRDGLLNYSFTRILHHVYPKNKYHDLNEAVGMLECMKQEFYRTRVGPYEDEKIEENGDVEMPEGLKKKDIGSY